MKVARLDTSVRPIVHQPKRPGQQIQFIALVVLIESAFAETMPAARPLMMFMTERNRQIIIRPLTEALSFPDMMERRTADLSYGEMLTHDAAQGGQLRLPGRVTHGPAAVTDSRSKCSDCGN